jgi:hypothetical protein
MQTKLPCPVQLFAFTLILSSAGMGVYHHITYKKFPYGTYLPSFYFNRGLPQSYLIDPQRSSTDTLSPATRKILHLTD